MMGSDCESWQSVKLSSDSGNALGRISLSLYLSFIPLSVSFFLSLSPARGASFPSGRVNCFVNGVRLGRKVNI